MELLADPAARREACRFAADIVQLGGGHRAVDKIVALNRRSKIGRSLP